MKKLLSLVLVLAMASLASAVIVSPMQLNANEDFSVISIELTSGMSSAVDGSGGYWVLTGVENGALAATLPSSLDGCMVFGDADGIAGFVAGDGIWGIFSATATSAWSAAAGIYADSFTLKAGATAISLYKTDDELTTPTLVMTIPVPEPATIALLCIGGMLLRKKK